MDNPFAILILIALGLIVSVCAAVGFVVLFTWSFMTNDERRKVSDLFKKLTEIRERMRK